MRLPSLFEIDAALAERSLAHFVRQAWHVVEPQTPLIWGWHLDAIAEHLEAVTRGEIRNLVINIGPGHMKSLVVSVFWPAWEWLSNPSSRWLFSSYAQSLSIRDSVRCRRLIKSPWYQERWSKRFALADDQDVKTKFENDRTGYRIATSVGGAATGERGSRVVVDDPNNVKERESRTKRDAVNTWWDEVMSTRLSDPKRDAKIIIQQRVHEKDLTGHVLGQGGFEHLCLPTEFDPDRRCVTSIGWQDPRTERGQLLFPDRFGADEAKDARLRLGTVGYAGQHLQSPTPAAGAAFNASWFRHYTVEGDEYVIDRGERGPKRVKVNDCDRFATCDPAGTDKADNADAAFTVAQAWDVTPDGEMLLVDQLREQVETPVAARHIIEFCRRLDVPWAGVERDGLGLGIVQTLRHSGLTVRAIKAKGSKEARSQTAEIRMEAGLVYFPRGVAWWPDLENELLRFPASEWKDQVDALSHAAIYVHRIYGLKQGEDEDDEQQTQMHDDEAGNAELAERYRDAEEAREADRRRSWLVGYDG